MQQVNLDVKELITITPLSLQETVVPLVSGSFTFIVFVFICLSLIMYFINKQPILKKYKNIIS